jgi:tRNA A37 threonylcarbamoyladenosine biosynthesis protein TsaE
MATKPFSELEAKQKSLYKIVVTHWEDVLYNFCPDQLLIHLDGKAGMGKTTVVQAM